MSGVAWTLVAVAATGLMVRDVGTAAWARNLGTFLVAAVPWVLASPIIVFQTRRVSLFSRRWPWSLMTHAVGGMAWTTIAAIIATSLLALLGGRSPSTAIDSTVTWARPDLWIDYALYWGVVGVGEIVNFNQWRRARERHSEQLVLRNAQLEAQLATARLQALQSRVEPHFLFNALNSISALMRRGDSTAAISMLAGVGDLLRHAISRSDAQTVALGDELAMVRRYLAIEQVRLGDRFRIEVTVPEPLLCVSVPTLLLQPLVENAVRHGIAHVSGAAVLRILVTRDTSSMRIEVFNTGPHIPPAVLASETSGATENQERRGGLGISLTRSRLELAYGDDARLTLANAADGATAVIELPLRGPHALSEQATQ